jgi:hypothetical protein
LYSVYKETRKVLEGIQVANHTECWQTCTTKFGRNVVAIQMEDVLGLMQCTCQLESCNRLQCSDTYLDILVRSDITIPEDCGKVMDGGNRAKIFVPRKKRFETWQICFGLNALPKSCVDMQLEFWDGEHVFPDEGSFLQAFEVTSEILLSPIEIQAHVLSTSQVQQLYYQNAPRMSDIIGPISSESDRLEEIQARQGNSPVRSGRRASSGGGSGAGGGATTVAAAAAAGGGGGGGGSRQNSGGFAEKVILVAPPLLLQKRTKASTCELNSTTSLLKSQLSLIKATHCRGKESMCAAQTCDHVFKCKSINSSQSNDDKHFGLQRSFYTRLQITKCWYEIDRF